MKAFELMGEVDEQGRLRAQLPDDCAPGPVRVLVLAPENGSGTNTKTQNGQHNPDKDGYDDLLAWIDGLAVDTGIEDLAHQHDHYIHGTPKRSETESES